MISIDWYLKYFPLLSNITIVLQELEDYLPKGYDEKYEMKRLASVTSYLQPYEEVRNTINAYIQELFLAVYPTVQQKLGTEVADRYKQWILNHYIGLDIYDGLLPNDANPEDIRILYILEQVFNEYQQYK